jgi:mycarose O-acyltransferase
MLLARVVLTGRRLPLDLGGAVALAIAAYALAPLAPRNANLVAVTVLPLGLVIAAGAVADGQGRRSWLSSRVGTWLGEISFAFYLWQFLVLTYGHHWLGGATKSFSTPAALGVSALFLVVTLALAWLQFVLIERPLVRLVGRRTKDRRSRVEVPEGTVPASPPAAEAA